MTPGKAPVPGERPRIVYFNSEIAHPGFNRRCLQIAAAGARVETISFRRQRFDPLFSAPWPNCDLGRIPNGQYWRRALAWPAAVRKASTQLLSGPKPAQIWARNLDMAILALVSRRIAKLDAPFVYEVLDLLPALLASGPVGVVMRRGEDIVLSQAARLVTSSPGFVQARYSAGRAPTTIIEPKLPKTIGSRPSRRRLRPGRPLKIGWFGTLRCVRSFQLLCGLVQARANDVQVVLAGDVSRLMSEGAAPVEDWPSGMRFLGRYTSPSDLARLYDQVDVNWCLDFANGRNSALLLPNRLYEGGFFSVPALGRANTMTGARLQERGWGWALREPSSVTLHHWLTHFDEFEWSQMHERLLGEGDETFCEGDEVRRLIVELQGP